MIKMINSLGNATTMCKPIEVGSFKEKGWKVVEEPKAKAPKEPKAKAPKEAKES